MADVPQTHSPAVLDALEIVRLRIANDKLLAALKALEEIAAGLADTGSTPGQRMTRITKADAYEIARAAIANAEEN